MWKNKWVCQIWIQHWKFSSWITIQIKKIAICTSVYDFSVDFKWFSIWLRAVLQAIQNKVKWIKKTKACKEKNVSTINLTEFFPARFFVPTLQHAQIVDECWKPFKKTSQKREKKSSNFPNASRVDKSFKNGPKHWCFDNVIFSSERDSIPHWATFWDHLEKKKRRQVPKAYASIDNRCFQITIEFFSRL